MEPPVESKNNGDSEAVKNITHQQSKNAEEYILSFVLFFLFALIIVVWLLVVLPVWIPFLVSAIIFDVVNATVSSIFMRKSVRFHSLPVATLYPRIFIEMKASLFSNKGDATKIDIHVPEYLIPEIFLLEMTEIIVECLKNRGVSEERFSKLDRFIEYAGEDRVVAERIIDNLVYKMGSDKNIKHRDFLIKLATSFIEHDNNVDLLKKLKEAGKITLIVCCAFAYAFIFYALAGYALKSLPFL